MSSAKRHRSKTAHRTAQRRKIRRNLNTCEDVPSRTPRTHRRYYKRGNNSVQQSEQLDSE